jgi:Zn-dependent oligopeptidase
MMMADNNPFLRVSLLPYQAPQFDLIDDTHYRPAFDEGVRRQREEIAAIVNNPAPADFANTLVALEQSGQLLARVTRVFLPWPGRIPTRRSRRLMSNFLLSWRIWEMISGLTRRCSSA